MTDTSAGSDLFFVLMGAILVFAMHGGFAFLEVGTVRHKNQVNALVKIIVDFAISTTAYFAIGYTLAYGIGFFESADTLINGEAYGPQGLLLVKFFFLATFAAAVPAIISGGIAERMRFLPQCLATAVIVALVYALFEGTLLSLSGFLIDFVVLTAMALLAYRVTLVRKMVSQYPWRYERVSLFNYRERPGQA